MHPCQRRLLWSSMVVAWVLSASASGQDITYQYDDLGRLISVDHATGESVDYAYDPAGNRTSVVTSIPLAAFSVADSMASEGNVVVFTVTRSAVLDSAVSVDYATAVSGTASASDFTAASGALNFAVNETTKTVNVSSIEDTLFEGNETFSLLLSNPSTFATISDGDGLGTINDDDVMPSFSINNVSVSEGGALGFTVTRSGDISLINNVNYATSNGTAGGADYTAASGTLSFAANQTTKPVSVSSIEDALYEPGETINVTLSAATGGATISDNLGVGTINNDDAAPAFSVNNVSVSEGGTLSFTVTKSGGTVYSHNVSYATANGAAVAGSDYTAKSGTLTFTSAQTSKTVSVSTIEDTVYEANEAMYLNLSSATSGATISDSQGVGTINNDDAQIVYVRNAAGTLQAGYTQSSTYNWKLGYIHKTKAGTTVIHSAVNAIDGLGYCDTGYAPITGYSWTSNGCEMRVD